ncbi:MAG: hypothetical protein ACOCZK_06080 [Planctomycetota bacterium]
MLRPLYLAPDATPRADAIGVGGPGAPDLLRLDATAIDAAPPAIRADSLAAMALRASRRPELLTRAQRVACHALDADAIAATIILCRPDLAAEYGPALIAAGLYDACCLWTMEAGGRLALYLRERTAALDPAGDNAAIQDLLDTLVDDLPTLYPISQRPDNTRELQIEQICSLRTLLLERPQEAPLRVQHARGFSLVVGLWQHGHHHPGAGVHVPDDCPAWSLSDVVPETNCRLLVLHHTAGTYFQFDAPPHSWAQTVRRPRVAWPDCRGLAARLGADDTASWLARPHAAVAGRTCLLVTRNADGQPAFSDHDRDHVCAAVGRLLGIA